MSDSLISSLLTSPTASKLSPFSKSSASAAKANATAQSAEQKFLDYAKKTPAEKLRASLLASAGVTEDQLQSMSPDQRKAIEQKIADQVKQAAEKQASKGQSASGFFTDMKV